MKYKTDEMKYFVISNSNLDVLIDQVNDFIIRENWRPAGGITSTGGEIIGDNKSYKIHYEEKEILEGTTSGYMTIPASTSESNPVIYHQAVIRD